jgi:hypothetical protein
VDVNELRELRRAADLSQRQLADFLTIAAKRLNSAGPWRIAVDSIPTRQGVGSGLPSRVRRSRAHDHYVRRDTMPGRERRSLQPTANWQVWTMVFVVLVLIMTIWLMLR